MTTKKKTPVPPKAPAKKKVPAKKKTPVPPKAPDFETAAALVKERLIQGKATKEEIEEEVLKTFPDYGALKIAVGVYRRELRKKGLLKEGA